MTAELGTGEVEQVLEWVGLDDASEPQGDDLAMPEVALNPPVKVAVRPAMVKKAVAHKDQRRAKPGVHKKTKTNTGIKR